MAILRNKTNRAGFVADLSGFMQFTLFIHTLPMILDMLLRNQIHGLDIKPSECIRAHKIRYHLPHLPPFISTTRRYAWSKQLPHRARPPNCDHLILIAEQELITSRSTENSHFFPHQRSLEHPRFIYLTSLFDKLLRCPFQSSMKIYQSFTENRPPVAARRKIWGCLC